jgi:phosphate transport system protein
MTADSGPRIAYHEQLGQLRNTVLRLGTFAEEALAQAMTALLSQDVALARQVHQSDDVADDLDHEIDRLSVSLLVSQQPVSGDLRAIVGALKITTDFERIADYAKDIAKTAVAMEGQQWSLLLEDARRLGELVAEQLRGCLRAFADHDLARAQEVMAGDEKLDALWRQVRADLEGRMAADGTTVPQAVRLILVARYLERIGDHIVNVMERLQYIDTGRYEPVG